MPDSNQPAAQERAPQPDTPHEFDGMSVANVPKTYSKDTDVFVFHKGSWKRATLAEPAGIDSGKFVMDAVLEGETNPTHFELDYRPKDIPANRKKGEEAFDGLVIAEVSADKKGNVVYTLEKKNARGAVQETHYGVQEELVKAAREVRWLREEMKKLKSEIESVMDERSTQLHQHRADAETKLMELEAKMPGLSQAQEFANFKQQYDTLFTHVAKKVNDLQYLLSQEIVAPPLERKEPTHFAKTEKEKEGMKKRKKDISKRIKKTLEQAFAKEEVKKLETARREKEERLNNKYNAAIARYPDEVDAWKKSMSKKHHISERDVKDNDPLLPKPTKPTKPQKRDFELTQIEKSNEQENAVVEAMHNILDGLEQGSGDAQFLLKEITKRRKVRAANELDKKRIDASTGDYDGTNLEIESKDIVDEIVAEWSSDDESEEALPEDAVVFDFEKEFNSETEGGLAHDAKMLLEQVSNDDGTAKSGLENMHQRVKDYIHMFGVIGKALETFGGAVEFTRNVPANGEGAPTSYRLHLTPSELDTIVQMFLDNKQQDWLNAIRSKYARQFSRDLELLEAKVVNAEDSIAAAKARHSADRAVEQKKTELEQKAVLDRAEGRDRPKINRADVPAHVVAEIFGHNQAQTRDAIQSIDSHTVESLGAAQAAGLPDDIVDRVRALFDVADANKPDIEKKFAAYGIYDFDAFKESWDSQIAPTVARSLEMQAQAQINAMVAEKLASWQGALKKGWRIKDQIGLRLLTTAALVGGAATATGFAVGTGGIGAIILGGFSGGMMRGWLNKKVFGSKFFQERSQKALQGLKKEETDAVQEELMERYDEGVASGVSIAEFSYIVSQAIREITNDADQSDADTEIEEVTDLNANARACYEQALLKLETKNPSEQQRKELAIAISRMVSHTDERFEQAVAQASPETVGALDALLSTYSGQRGMIAAGASGAAIATLFGYMSREPGAILGGIMDNSELARGTLGAAFGAIAGYKWADRWHTSTVRREMKNKMDDHESILHSLIARARHGQTIDDEDAQQARDIIAHFERIIRGTASQDELSAVVYIQSEYQTDPQTGESKQVSVPYPDVSRLKGLQSMLHEARREGLDREKKEDAADLQKVLEGMTARTDAIEKELRPETKKRLLSFFGKNFKRAVGTVGGAVGGALVAIAAGNVFRAGMETLGLDTGPRGASPTAEGTPTSSSEASTAAGAAVSASEGTVASQEPGGVQGIQQRLGAALDVAQRSEYEQAHPSAEPFEIQKGQGLLHAANHFENNEQLRSAIIADIKENHADWTTRFETRGKQLGFHGDKLTEFVEEKLMHQWRQQEVARFGVIVPGDGEDWMYTKTLHTGAKVELVFGEHGPQLSIADESKSAGLVTEHAPRSFGPPTSSPEAEVVVLSGDGNTPPIHLPRSRGTIIFHYDDIRRITRWEFEPAAGSAGMGYPQSAKRFLGEIAYPPALLFGQEGNPSAEAFAQQISMLGNLDDARTALLDSGLLPHHHDIYKLNHVISRQMHEIAESFGTSAKYLFATDVVVTYIGGEMPQHLNSVVNGITSNPAVQDLSITKALMADPYKDGQDILNRFTQRFVTAARQGTHFQHHAEMEKFVTAWKAYVTDVFTQTQIVYEPAVANALAGEVVTTPDSTHPLVFGEAYGGKQPLIIWDTAQNKQVTVEIPLSAGAKITSAGKLELTVAGEREQGVVGSFVDEDGNRFIGFQIGDSDGAAEIYDLQKVVNNPNANPRVLPSASEEAAPLDSAPVDDAPATGDPAAESQEPVTVTPALGTELSMAVAGDRLEGVIGVYNHPTTDEEFIGFATDSDEVYDYHALEEDEMARPVMSVSGEAIPTESSADAPVEPGSSRDLEETS